MKIRPIYCIFIVGILISCSPNQNLESKNEFNIPELNEYYQTLLSEAQKWSADAYFYSVDIPIRNGPWVLSASFYSPTKHNESLQILVDFQNTLSTRVFSQEPEILQEEPILISQWKIGSKEALNIFISENNAINSIDNLCGFLKLSRVPIIENRPLVWWLTYYECGSFSSNYLYLNPMTGEMIEP